MTSALGAMPHFYFDLLEDGAVVPDDTGLVLENLEQAKLEARKALADLVREEIRDGNTIRRPGEVSVQIRYHDEGPVVMTIAYSITDRSNDA